MELTQEQIERYGRHIILKEVGAGGQKKLLGARALIVGAGGLGSPSAFYLAAAGIGSIGILDSEAVDLSNLQRQILYATDDVGRPKAESAKETLAALNPDVDVTVYNERLTAHNAFRIIEDYDVVVDACDNFATRYLANDACVLLGKPCVHGSVFLYEGQVTVFDSARGPCYRCQYPEPPPPGAITDPREAGVLGVAPGIIGTVQATETAKLLLGVGKPLIGRLLHFDVLGMKFREFTLRKNPDCPVCGDDPTITELIDYERFCEGSEQEG